MIQLIQILGLPLIACILMSTILGYFGTHVLKREVIFIDIALAQIAAVGSIASHLIFEVHDDSLLAYGCSFACVLLASAFYTFARNRISQISLEAIIGITYAIAAAAALFLVGVASGGHIHIQNILSGSLLWTNWRQILTSLIVFALIGMILYFIRKPLSEISDSCRRNTTKQSQLLFWDFIFYVLLGVVITLSVHIGGVVVVFAYLIIPATISVIFSAGLKMRAVIIIASSITASVGGLLFAYYLDFSIGPAIAMFLGSELILASLAFHSRQ